MKTVWEMRKIDNVQLQSILATLEETFKEIDQIEKVKLRVSFI